MRVLGIDPGIGRIGFGVLERQGHDGHEEISLVEYGLITTKNDDRSARLKQIHESVVQLIHKFKPNCLAVERLFFNKNVRTAMSVSESIGVILLAANQSSLPVNEYTPPQVKEVVVGSGKAKKQEVKGMMEIFLNQKIKGPDDVADALAIAFCHLAMESLGKL